MQINFGETTLPILREADIAVVGGSLAGIAAALRLARDGQSVILIEPRTYLGREITATLRPWLTPGEWKEGDFLPKPIGAMLDAHDRPADLSGGEIPLHPDTVKRSLEDALLAANVDLLYVSLPTGLCETGLVIGNKSGRQVIRCQTIIDATETALVARLAGGTFVRQVDGPVRFARTLEYDRVQPIADQTLPVPGHLDIAGNVVRLHTGYRGPGHLLLECALDLPLTPGLEGSAYVELEARRRTMRLAAHLVSHYPELASGRFAGSSHELHGRWTPSLASPPPAWSAFAAGAVAASSGDGGTFSASMAQFAGPVPELWCLNEAARLDPEQATWFLDPVRASRIGESFAATLMLLQAEQEGSTVPRLGAAYPSQRSTNGEVALLEVREPVSPQRGRPYARQPVTSTTVPVHRVADVLVVGGGSSGATAAITAAIVLVLLATVWRERRTPAVTLIRGAAVAYMTTTGVVYGLLLTGYTEELGTVVPWVNTIVHRIMPLVMVIDWMIERPRFRLDFRRCLVWMAFPLLYFLYSLVRGSSVDWYPYPFFDPDQVGGYAGVAAYAVAIAFGFVVFIWLIVTLGNRPWEKSPVAQLPA